MTRFRPIILAMLWGLLISGIQIFCSLMDRSYYLTQLTMSAYYALVVMGLCVLMGYAGQASLGHAAFFAIGGYGSAYLTTADVMAWPGASFWLAAARMFDFVVERTTPYGTPVLSMHPWLALAVSVALCAIASLIIGYPALRLKGHYLAMATLGFGLIIYRLVLGTEWLGAADGITAVPGFPLPGAGVISEQRDLRISNYYVAWGIVLLVYVGLLNLLQSRHGRVFKAIHEHEIAAASVGIPTERYRLRTFVLSAIIAGVAGSLMTHYTGGIGPSESGAAKSVRYLALVAAGGMANLTGCLVISTLINFLSLRGSFGTLDHAVFGGILIVTMWFCPEGPLTPLREMGHSVLGFCRGRKHKNEFA